MLLRLLTEGRDRKLGGAIETVSIRDPARVAGVTVRALRHYEDKGLLRPSGDAHMRRYDSKGRARAVIIAHLRRAGLSLQDIRSVLGSADSGAVDADAVGFVRARLLERLVEFARIADSDPRPPSRNCGSSRPSGRPSNCACS